MNCKAPDGSFTETQSHMACCSCRFLAGRSEDWLEKLRKQLEELPHAGLGEVCCRLRHDLPDALPVAAMASLFMCCIIL